MTASLAPDLIINPHAMPSRMTLGQLMESVLGKASVHKGYFGDCTAFNRELNYNENFNRMGYHSSGTEVLKKC
jgi:DNA-directed RNA polymerase II subunit RPB2